MMNVFNLDRFLRWRYARPALVVLWVAVMATIIVAQ
jgi:hypothetical protein